jgi:flagellar biosynthesis anti-sigma factor FlgM
MKIESGIRPLSGPQGKRAADRAAEKKASARPAQEEGSAFSVKLSTTTEKLLSAAPVEESIRWETVNAIRDQLASGTYNISGSDVAAKMLNLLKG